MPLFTLCIYISLHENSFLGRAAPRQFSPLRHWLMRVPQKSLPLFLFNFCSLLSWGKAEIAGVPLFSMSVSATGLNSLVACSLLLTGVLATAGDATLLCWFFLYLRVQREVTIRAMKTTMPTQIKVNVSTSRPKSTVESSSSVFTSFSGLTGSGVTTGPVGCSGFAGSTTSS